MLIKKTFLAITLFTLVACAGQPQPTPTATLAPTVPPTKVTPTVTATVMSTVTPTYKEQSWAFASPPGQSFGKWFVKSKIEDPSDTSLNNKYHLQLDVRNEDGTKQITILDEWQPYDPKNYSAPQILDWSDRGNFLFANIIQTNSCNLFETSTELKRFNLNTGKIEEVIPTTGKTISVSRYNITSQSKTLMAYIVYEEKPKLIVSDLKSGVERKVDIINTNANSQVGGIVWSPDETVIMFTSVTNCNQPNEVFSIIKADIKALTQEIVPIKDIQSRKTVSWLLNGLISLQGRSDRDYVWLNPATKEITNRGADSYVPISPDKKWVGSLYTPGPSPNEAPRIKLIRANGSAELNVIDTSALYSLTSLPVPIKWSQDGRFLFYYIYRGEEGGCFLANGTNLKILDTHDSSVTEIFLPRSSILSISPNDALVAYATGGNLFVQKLRDGTQTKIELGEGQPSSIIWSADSKELVLSMLNICPEKQDGSVIYIDLATKTKRTLISKDKHIFRPITWVDENTILLKDWDAIEYQMNLLTAEVKLKTSPTPTK